jgi:hypothetical protein
MKKQLEEFRYKAIKLANAINHKVNIHSVSSVIIQVDGNIVVEFDTVNGNTHICLSADDINSDDFEKTANIIKKNIIDKENVIKLRELDIKADNERKILVEEKAMYLRLKAKFEGENKY